MSEKNRSSRVLVRHGKGDVESHVHGMRSSVTLEELSLGGNGRTKAEGPFWVGRVE